MKKWNPRNGKVIMEVESGERMHTCYVLELSDGTLFEILAKELVSGRLEFVLTVQDGNENGILVRVRDVEKAYYDEAVSNLVRNFECLGMLAGVKTIHPDQSGRGLLDEGDGGSG